MEVKLGKGMHELMKFENCRGQLIYHCRGSEVRNVLTAKSSTSKMRSEKIDPIRPCFPNISAGLGQIADEGE